MLRLPKISGSSILSQWYREQLKLSNFRTISTVVILLAYNLLKNSCHKFLSAGSEE